MTIFLSHYINKIDNKYRVSIPSQFRSIINKDSDSNIIVIYKSIINECIEACMLSRMEKISEAIEEMDIFSEERDAFATSILGMSIYLQIDKDGRVVLPKDIVEDLGINEKVVFIGKGSIFEIWPQEKFEKYKTNSQKISFEKRSSLKPKK